MNQKHLLRFIKKTLKTDGDVPVCKVLLLFWPIFDFSKSILKAGDKQMTLKEVFESLNLTAYDLTVDMLDVHAVRKEAFI